MLSTDAREREMCRVYVARSRRMPRAGTSGPLFITPPEAGATSARAAQSVYTAIYRRRWGCETALQGARLRFARAYLVSGGDIGGAPRGGTRPTFDPGDADHFAAAASPVLRGMPAGQRN